MRTWSTPTPDVEDAERRPRTEAVRDQGREVRVTYVSTSRDIGWVIGVAAMVMVMLVRATDAPAQRPDCVARGTFVFTLAEGFGRLDLLADGSAEMVLAPTHEACPQCLIGGRILRGTYRTPRFDDGQCIFQLR